MNSLSSFRICIAVLVVWVGLEFRPRLVRAAEADPPPLPAAPTNPAATPAVTPTNLATPASADVSATTNSAPAVPATNNPVAELRAAQEAIEQLRRELEVSSARNAEAITAGLSLIEPTLARMHERQMEAVQSSNRTILIVAGVFAAVGLVGLVFISLILVRAIGRFSEMAVMGAPRALLGAGHALPALGEGEMRPGAAERASGRFQGAIDQLQQRVRELESGLQASGDVAAPLAVNAPRPAQLEAPGVSNIQPLPPASPTLPAPGLEPASGAAASRTTVLLGKGQALLNLDSAEQALQCFEEALTLEPNNAEVLVKKGMALEKLQDWEQALENYDRAIAIDGSLTVAYLYRGGVCNRLQRYREALESYEKALRTEKKSRAS
jgi:tetratricopeptide (TPR) repeat protein